MVGIEAGSPVSDRPEDSKERADLSNPRAQMEYLSFLAGHGIAEYILPKAFDALPTEVVSNFRWSAWNIRINFLKSQLVNSSDPELTKRLRKNIRSREYQRDQELLKALPEIPGEEDENYSGLTISTDEIQRLDFVISGGYIEEFTPHIPALRTLHKSTRALIFLQTLTSRIDRIQGIVNSNREGAGFSVGGDNANIDRLNGQLLMLRRIQDKLTGMYFTLSEPTLQDLETD